MPSKGLVFITVTLAAMALAAFGAILSIEPPAAAAVVEVMASGGCGDYLRDFYTTTDRRDAYSRRDSWQQRYQGAPFCADLHQPLYTRSGQLVEFYVVALWSYQ